MTRHDSSGLSARSSFQAAGTAPLPRVSGKRRLLDLLAEPTHDTSFDRLSHLARDLLDAPMAVVTVLDEERNLQLFRSIAGTHANLGDARHTPLSHSFCRIAAESDTPLRIDDAERDPRARCHPAWTELGIRSYLGCPIHTRDGTAIGAICVVDDRPRAWSDADVRLLSQLAGCADDALRFVVVDDDADCARRETVRAELARDLFFFGMNHEIRTELNGVIGLAEILEEAAPDAETRELSRAIGRSGRKLASMLVSFLNASLGGRDVLDDDAGFGVRELFSEVSAVLASAGHAAACPARFDVAADVPALSSAAAGRLRLVLYDLLCETSDEVGCSSIAASLEPNDMLRLDICFALRGGWLAVADGDTERHDPDLRRLRTLLSTIGGTIRARRVGSVFSTCRIDMPLCRPAGRGEDTRSAA